MKNINNSFIKKWYKNNYYLLNNIYNIIYNWLINNILNLKIIKTFI